MIKLGISMGSATLVAMLILIGGSFSDVSMWVVLTRCVSGFFIVGAIAYAVTFILESRGIIGFDKAIDSDDDDSNDNFTSGRPNNSSANGNQGGAEDGSSGFKFTPLAAETLKSQK